MTPGFLFSPESEVSVPASPKVIISNFMRLFFLKGKLTGQKTDTADFCFDSEGLWKVSAKSGSRFPIQLCKKWYNLFKQARRSKIQISVFVLSKGEIA